MGLWGRRTLWQLQWMERWSLHYATWKRTQNKCCSTWRDTSSRKMYVTSTCKRDTSGACGVESCKTWIIKPTKGKTTPQIHSTCLFAPNWARETLLLVNALERLPKVPRPQHAPTYQGEGEEKGRRRTRVEKRGGREGGTEARKYRHQLEGA